MKYPLFLFLLTVLFYQLPNIISTPEIDDNEFAEFEISDELEMSFNNDIKEQQIVNDEIKNTKDETPKTVCWEENFVVF